MEEVGVREAKAKLSEYLRKVKAGETVVITEHGVPVGKLVPMEETVPDGLQQLLNSGAASWGGGKPKGHPNSPSISGSRTIAEVVEEDRR